MHLAYLCEDAGIPIDGSKGSSIHVRSMVKAFAQAGATVSLISPRIGDTQWGEGLPIEFHQLTSASNGSENPGPAAERLAEVNKHLAIDAVYERLSLFASSGSAFCAEHNILHGIEVNAPLADEAEQHRALKNADEARRVEKTILNRADILFPVSPLLMRWLVGKGCDQENIEVLPNGIQNEWLSNRPHKSGAHDTRIKIGFVGSLRKWHDLKTVLAALSLLPADKYELLVVGDGPLRKEMKQWIEEYALADRVDMAGMLSHEKVVGAIDEMDCCVAPYTGEGDFYFCPIKVLEYGARGKPVFAADIPELREQFPDNTLLYYRPGDPAALAEALRRLHEDDEQAAARAEALNAFVSGHTWLSHAQLVLRRLKEREKASQ